MFLSGSSKVVSKAMDDARNVPKAKDDAGNDDSKVSVLKHAELMKFNSNI